ncbi:MAG: hypothetical protein V4581_05675 [Bacteroidota bacterium]
MKSVFILLFIVLISCKSLQRKEVYGTYISNIDDFHTEAIFNKDSFNFSVKGHLFDIKSAGTWKLKNHSLYLLSDIKYKTDYITVEEKTIPHEGYIQVLDADSYPLAGVSVYLNESPNALISDENGRISLAEKPIVCFEVAYITLSKMRYSIKDTNTNIWIVTVFEQDPTGKKYFDITKWRFTTNGIKTEHNIMLKKIY